MARKLVLAQSLAREVLQFIDKLIARRAAADDERFGYLATCCIRYADDGCFPDILMLEQRILDLNRAHGPTGRDDHIVSPSGMIEVTILIGLSEILRGLPLVAPPEHQLADDTGLGHGAIRFLHLQFASGHGLTQRAG